MDNDPISSKATQNALASAGFDPRMFADADEGLNYLKAKPADLVVLDIMIAAQGGFNLYDKMRELPLHKQTPVIFIANPSDPRVSANVVPTYQTQFLVKPQNMTNYLELALKALSRVLKHYAENRSAAPLAGSQATTAAPQPAAVIPAPHKGPAERRAEGDRRISPRRRGAGSWTRLRQSQKCPQRLLSHRTSGRKLPTMHCNCDSRPFRPNSRRSAKP